MSDGKRYDLYSHREVARNFSSAFVAIIKRLPLPCIDGGGGAKIPDIEYTQYLQL